MSEEGFNWVRSSFRKLLSTSPPHVAKVESWIMATAWLLAPVDLQRKIVESLKEDLGDIE